MSKNNRGNEAVKSVENLFRIMEYLKDEDGGGVTEIADELDISKSTVHRHLVTMERNRFAVKEDGSYHLGLRFLEYGNFAKNRKDPYRLARDIVANLAEETSERAQFLVEEHGRAICVHREMGERAVGTNFNVGEHEPMHATAAGKALLSQMSREEVLDIVESRGLTEFTDDTITDEERLLEELADIRERGISYNDGEYIEGLRAIGVPLFDSATDEVIGALTVSGPSNRMTDARIDEELEDVLLGAANELELRISYPR